MMDDMEKPVTTKVISISERTSDRLAKEIEKKMNTGWSLLGTPIHENGDSEEAKMWVQFMIVQIP